MQLILDHTTHYLYSEPVPHAMQQLRLHPRNDPGQSIDSWSVELEGAIEQVRYTDQHGNQVSLVAVVDLQEHVQIRVRGEVSTTDLHGVVGADPGPMPLWAYLRDTPLTEPGPRVDALVEGLDETDETGLDELHELSERVAGAITYEIGQTTATTTAEDALDIGAGVCQDHAHVFIAAARRLGVPARYVSGYLRMDDTIDQAATHAWAQAHVAHLGWVGFDVSNGISPDARYVRLAAGLDYRDAAPISGVRLGGGHENLSVTLQVADTDSAQAQQ